MAKNKGKTRSGFEFEVDADVMDDMYMIEAIADTMNDNPIALSKVCTMLFGKEQKERLYKHLEDEKGKVRVEKIGEEIVDVFASFGEQGKN